MDNTGAVRGKQNDFFWQQLRCMYTEQPRADNAKIPKSLQGTPSICGFCVSDLLRIFMKMHMDRHVQFLGQSGDPAERFIRHSIGCVRAKGSADQVV